MTPVLAPALLVLLLLASALSGPWLLRRAAPALARTPRLAAGMLIASITLWLLALLALGPMLAWIASGPSLLTGRQAEVCQRCLDANPFTGTTVDTILPPVLLLALPVFGALFVAGVILRHAVRRHRAIRATGKNLAEVATEVRLAGYRVLLVPDSVPAAFALPRGRGGIVVSDGALGGLDDSELAAVLAHEHAHLRQHHHLVRTLVEGFARPLRWVPLVTAATDAVPHYLEIAADDAARRHAGTPALAGALLKLGERQTTSYTTSAQHTAGHILHAAGPDRIHHLVAPARTRTGAGASLASFLNMTTLGVVGVTIFTAVITGCA